ncbi:MAG: hypothetical protein EHM58_07665 [Ignavibacteriae bacterium]|nr:MAG: hypothetical protein EHM58_07665 [Ignavibacteriota bacterium]
MYKKLFLASLFILLNTALFYSQSVNLDSAYYFLNKGDTKTASLIFENHLKLNPKDTKTRLQLGYIYYNQNRLSKSLTNFEYVGNHSTDSKDVETSKSAAYVIKEQLALTAPRALDLYFYNFYESNQDNYIANLVAHYNFRMAPQFYTGLYADVYTDSRSKPGLIYNDRFVELGGFFRYNILKNLLLEFRLGYARKIDQDSSTINVKPILVYFTRFGEGKVFVNKSSQSKTSMFLDLYYALMYDFKYKNAFAQATFNEVLRFHTGGYSYIESYLVQYAQFDSRKLDYNNYAEFGTGLRFKPNIAVFPVLFIEPTAKLYFFKDPVTNIKKDNTFQIKAGFQFIFRTPL